MQTVNEVLEKCKIKGMVVILPEEQLDRKLYTEVAKKLELIGGKWNRKEKGFLFKEDPTELLGRVSSGENVNLKKEFQFFPTPNELADKLVSMAEINNRYGMDSILEPSAGQGAIINAIIRAFPEAKVDYCELMEINRSILEGIKNTTHVGDDFILIDNKPRYNRIIANPPFSKNQDIDHVYKMFGVLNPGGIMVSITSAHWLTAQEKKCVQFREWLDNQEKSVEFIEKDAFKEIGTMVGGVILKIKKKL